MSTRYYEVQTDCGRGWEVSFILPADSLEEAERKALASMPRSPWRVRMAPVCACCGEYHVDAAGGYDTCDDCLAAQ